MPRPAEKTCFLNERGFTLGEVLVAMGVFAILAAIAVPNFVAMMPTYRLNGAARAVFSDLMWARSKAVEENTAVVVTIPDDTTTYTLIGGTVNRTRNIQTDYLDVTMTKAAGNDPTFGPRGTTTTGATTVTVTNTNTGETRTVTVSTTGIVKID